MSSTDSLQAVAQRYGLSAVTASVVGSLALYAGKLVVKRALAHQSDSATRARRSLHRVTRDLTTHNFFITYLNALHLVIPNIRIACPMRQLMFRDLLSIRTQVFYDGFLAFVGDHALEVLDSGVFQQMVCNLYASLLNEFEVRCLREGIQPAVVSKFNYWHADTAATTLNFLTQATSSTFYTSNTMRMVAILDWFTASLQVTMFNAERTLGELNGELDNVVYKGIRAVAQHTKESPCQPSKQP